MPDTKRTQIASSGALRTMRRARWALALLFVAVFGVAAAACASVGATDPTPVLVFKITPASGTYAAPSPATPTAVARGSATAGSSGSIKLVGQDVKFDQKVLSAAAGALTISFSNKDSGVPHNLHVFAGGDAKGQSVGETDLEPGPIDQELKLNLAPGAYFYQCDAHPATMKGTLTVS